MAIGTIPPWLNVSPSDFLRAMQAGAGAGLQVAQLRQSGRLEENRLAQAAAQAAAARADAAAARQAAMDFQQWQEGERARQQAAELAQRERIAMAGLEERGQLAEAQLGQRSLEAALRGQTELTKSRETERHQRAMEETAKGRLELGRAKLEADLDRLKAHLDVPTRYHLTTVQGKVIATDPITGDSFVAYPKEVSAAKPTVPTVSTSPFGFPQTVPNLFNFPTVPNVDLSNGLTPINAVSSRLAAPQRVRYVFRDGELVPVQ